MLGTEIDITSEEEEEELSTPSPSLQLHHQPGSQHPTTTRGSVSPRKQRPTAEERLTRRNVRRAQSKPQYIGRLGGGRPRSRDLQVRGITLCWLAYECVDLFAVVFPEL